MYSTAESDNIGLTSCDMSLQGDRVFVGRSDGEVVQLDLRMRNKPVTSITAHDRVIKSVHMNPVYDHLLLSGSVDK